MAAGTDTGLAEREREILRQAKTLIRDNRLEEAETKLLEAVRGGVPTRSVVKQLMNALIRQESYSRAFDALRECALEGADLEQVVSFAARLLDDTGRMDDVQAIFRLCAELSSCEKDILRRISLGFRKNGRAAEAIAFLEDIDAARPGYRSVSTELARLHLAEGEPARAVELIGPIPRDWEGACIASRGLRQTGRVDEALSLLREMRRTHGEPPDEGLLELAESAFLQGELEEARSFCNAALQRGADTARLWSLVASIAAARHDNPEALEAYRVLTEDAPEKGRLWVKRAHLEMRSGDLRAAELSLEKALACEPHDAEARETLVDIYFSTGRLDLALESLREGPDGPDTRFRVQLSKALRLRGHLEEARHLGEKGLAEQPGDSRLLAEQARVLSAEGDFSQALELFERAEGAAGEGIFWEERHWLMLALDRLPEAWELSRRRVRRARLRVPAETALWTPGEELAKDPMVLAEQGIGDEIKFASVYADLVRETGSATITCDPRLKPMLERAFPACRFVPVFRFEPEPRLREGERSAPLPWEAGSLDPLSAAILSADAWEEARAHRQVILAADLLEAFRPAKPAFKSPAPLLAARPDLRRKWREKLDAMGGGRKIGLAWRSSASDPERIPFHAQLAEWLPLVRASDSVFVNLQHDVHEGERHLAKGVQNFTFLDDIDLKDDIEDVAALMSELDLVISSHTMVKELAGAVGARVWFVYYSCHPQMQWRRGERDRDVWFPSIRHVYPRSLPSDPQRAVDDVAIRLAAENPVG